jgi:ABC-type lipopolysaccharide export system ATPase subunit
MLVNQTNDETFNHLQQKLVYYKQLSDEAFIMADIEIKKQDVWAKQRRIRQQLNKFNMYELPNRTNRWGYRRRYN